ncbi:MAG: hypothetical protein Q7R45_00095, partial [Sulfuricaulis sp.]|nr:hypothetical protein [Sulfuricaulis sp.]
TSPVNITNSGTTLTAQAGRSIFVNANITTNNANVRLTANETTANGVNSSYRDSGAAALSMASGKTINAGTGDIFLKMNNGSTSGNIVIENLTANNVSIIHDGVTSGSSILRNSASSLLSATNAAFMELETASGATASIGTSAHPIRVSTPVLEAHYHNASGGIFIDSPNAGALQIGGVPTSIFSGSVRGVQTVSGGPIQISANGNLSQLAGSAGCGLTGGAGGPICATTVGNINVTTSSGNITLNSDVLAAAGITVQAAGNLTQNSGNISNAAGFTTAGTNDVRLSGNGVTLGSVASQRDLFVTASGALSVGGVTTFGAQNFHVDDSYFSYTLPFAFSFYGTSYTTAYISSNGVISFVSGVSQFTDSISSLASYRIVAPAWNDWDTRLSQHDVYIANAASGLAVRWDVARFPNTSQVAQFEAILGRTGNITFNYGPANASFVNDVTIGLANQSTASRLISQLDPTLRPGFSLNGLNSTTFTYNTGSGSYTEAVSASSNWNTSGVAGAFSALRSAALTGGTSVALNGSLTAPTATLTAQNAAISQSAAIIASSLVTQSATGTVLTNTGNTIGSFRATNSGSGNITLTNSGALNLTGISQSGGGNVTLTTTGALTISGAVTTTGNIGLTAGGNIQETGSGSIAGALLTTSSATGTVLESSGNAVTSFNATNSGSGNVSFSNTAADLSVTGISQSGGNVTVANTGNVSIQDASVIASGAVGISGTDLNVTSVAGSALLHGASMSIVMTGAMSVQASANGSAQVLADNGQSITARSLDIRAGAADGANAFIQNSNGTQTVSATGAISITGGSQPHTVGASGARGYIYNAGTGLQTINAGTLTLQGGSSGSGNWAYIASDSSSLDVTVRDALRLIGGSGEGAEVLMYGSPDVILTMGGKVYFTTGAGTDAFARILAGSVDSVRLTFSDPSAGGFVVNGVSGVPTSGGSGFFAGSSRSALASTAPTPVTSANFHLSGATLASSETSQISQTTAQDVRAVSDTSIQATTTATTTASTAATQTIISTPAMSDTFDASTSSTVTAEESVSDREKKDDKAQEQKPKQAATSQASASKAAKPKPQLCN